MPSLSLVLIKKAPQGIRVGSVRCLAPDEQGPSPYHLDRLQRANQPSEVWLELVVAPVRRDLRLAGTELEADGIRCALRANPELPDPGLRRPSDDDLRRVANER